MEKNSPLLFRSQDRATAPEVKTVDIADAVNDVGVAIESQGDVNVNVTVNANANVLDSSNHIGIQEEMVMNNVHGDGDQSIDR